MNFWSIILLVDVIVAVLVLFLTCDLAIASARVIKSMPNYLKKETSLIEKSFPILSMIVRSLIPIYNIILLLGLLFCDRQEMIERVKAKYYAEMGE